MAATYPTTVISVDHCGAEVLTVRFARPDGYEFRAGQWLRLTLDTLDGTDVRTLSHGSAPADDWLEVTTRLSSSPFKQALAQLSVGDSVQVSAPGGRLRLPESAEKIAFLLGGVGAVPAHSLLREAVEQGRVFDDAVVFLGNRDDSCEPYRDAFEAMSGKGVSVVRVLERPPAGWQGESGFITADVVRRHADLGAPFLVAGPPIMVEVMAKVLDELCVPDEPRIVERFGPV